MLPFQNFSLPAHFETFCFAKTISGRTIFRIAADGSQISYDGVQDDLQDAIPMVPLSICKCGRAVYVDLQSFIFGWFFHTHISAFH